MPSPSSNPHAAVRLLAYCHEGTGIGHLRRTLTLCAEIAHRWPGASILLVTGTPFLHLFEPLPYLDWVKLPAISKSSTGNYSLRQLASHSGITQWRSDILMETVKGFDPTMVLVDKAPLGVCGELRPALTWLREHRPAARLVCGLRDIEDEPEVTIVQWQKLGVPDAIEHLFDEALVYGMKEIFDVAEQYRLSPEASEKLRYTGYVCRRHKPRASAAKAGGLMREEVVVTVGGGTDGSELIQSYLNDAVHRATALGSRSVIVGGPDLPRQDAEKLRRLAKAAGAKWLEFDSGLQNRLGRARLIVTMGGYNTMTESVASGRPTLVIPRTTPRKEQWMRAQLWAKRGLVSTLDPVDATPTRLAQTVADLLLAPPKPQRQPLELNGLDRVLDRLTHLAQEQPHATVVRV